MSAAPSPGPSKPPATDTTPSGAANKGSNVPPTPITPVTPVVKIAPPRSSLTSDTDAIPADLITLALRRLFRNKVIHPDNRLLRIWDAIILCFLWFYVFIIPLSMAWIDIYFTAPFITVQYIADVALLADCVVDIMTAYMNTYGQMVTDIASIKKYYLQQRKGYLEIFASLPWDVVFHIIYSQRPNLDLRIWPCLRLIKFLRMSKLLRHFYDLELPGMHPSISRLMKNIFMFLLVAHMNGCIFWFLNTFEEIDPHQPDQLPWVITSQLYNYNATFAFDELGHASEGAVPHATQYVGTFYSALRSIVFSFRPVNTNAERLFVLLEMLMGFMTYGSIFGNIESLIRTLDSAHALNDAGTLVLPIQLR